MGKGNEKEKEKEKQNLEENEMENKRIKNPNYAVIFTYSFDSDVAVYLFEKEEEAKKFLKEACPKPRRSFPCPQARRHNQQTTLQPQYGGRYLIEHYSATSHTHSSAIASTSTRTPLGRAFAATQERAGLPVK